LRAWRGGTLVRYSPNFHLHIKNYYDLVRSIYAREHGSGSWLEREIRREFRDWLPQDS
jgi:stringent starvation protein B